MKTPKAIIYTRVSTGEQAEHGTSLEGQELACLRKAAEIGAQVVALHSDPGVSGARYLTRPGIQAALACIEASKADVLIAMKLDRNGRDTAALLAIRKRVQVAGGTLVFADGANFENNATGDLLFTVNASFAEYERAVIRERTMRGSRRRAEEGIQPQRSHSPYGYHIVTKNDVLTGLYPAGTVGSYQVVEERAVWVRELFRRYESGESLRDLVRWLHENQVPTKNGRGVWYRCSAKAILENPVYKGEPAYGRRQSRTDEDRVTRGLKNATYTVQSPDDHIVTLSAPALIPVATWERCQRRFQENRQSLSGNPERRYLLSGWLRCPECDRAMTGRGNNDPHRRYYLCRHANASEAPGVPLCHRRYYQIDQTERAILNALFELARNPKLITAAAVAYNAEIGAATDPAQEIQAIGRELAALDQQEEATARAQVEAMMKGRGTQVYDRLLEGIGTQRRDLTTRLAALDTQPPQVQRLDPQTEVLKHAAALASMERVLQSDKLPVSVRHGILGGIVKAIRPVLGEEIDGEPVFEIQTVYNSSP